MTRSWPVGDPWTSLLDSARLGLESYNADGSLLAMNAAAREMFGVEGDIPDYNIFASPHVHPGVKSTLREGQPYVGFLQFDPDSSSFGTSLADPRWSAVAILPGSKGEFVALYGDAAPAP